MAIKRKADPRQDPFVWLGQMLGLVPEEEEPKPRTNSLRQVPVRPVISNTGGLAGRARREKGVGVSSTQRHSTRLRQRQRVTAKKRYGSPQ